MVKGSEQVLENDGIGKLFSLENETMGGEQEWSAERLINCIIFNVFV